MEYGINEKRWHELFEWGILIEGIYGLMETLAGISLLLVKKVIIIDAFFALTRAELLEDPQDSFLGGIYSYLQHLSFSTKEFAAAYIIFHGLIKIFLALALRREKVWAYLVAIWFGVAFTAYLGYRFTHTHSLILAGFIVLDIVFLVIIWHEWRYRKGLAGNQSSNINSSGV